MGAGHAAARDNIAASRPKGLIVAEDGLGGNLAWICEARLAKVPVYIVPYEFSGRRQIDLALSAQIEDYRVSGALAFFLAAARPKWVGIVNGQAVFRLPLRYALGYELAGVAPPKPWTVHGGNANTLFAESPQMVSHYRSEGLPGSKILETGSLAFDELGSELLKSPSSGGPLRILCALPPDYTAADVEYADLIAEWVSTARSFGNVTLQAHPAARETLTRLGYETDHRDITTLIANCDVFVTSVSSVIRLALAAAKPVVNVDIYNFGYVDYVDAGGAITVKDISELWRVLDELTRPVKLAQMQNAAKADADRWGKLTGDARAEVMKALGVKSSGRDRNATL